MRSEIQHVLAAQPRLQPTACGGGEGGEMSKLNSGLQWVHKSNPAAAEATVSTLIVVIRRVVAVYDPTCDTCRHSW
jgi:hypothetical protein